MSVFDLDALDCSSVLTLQSRSFTDLRVSDATSTYKSYLSHYPPVEIGVYVPESMHVGARMYDCTRV